MRFSNVWPIKVKGLQELNQGVASRRFTDKTDSANSGRGVILWNTEQIKDLFLIYSKKTNILMITTDTWKRKFSLHIYAVFWKTEYTIP